MWSVSIDDDIKNNSIKPVYLLYGSEGYLINQYKKKLMDAIGTDDMNTTCYFGKDTNVAEVIDQAETLPFLSEKRLIVLEDTGFAKNSCPQLAEYIPQVCETTIIIMVESETDKKNLVYKAIANYGSAVEFTIPEKDDLKTWVVSRLRKEGKTISLRAYNMLIDRAGDDMYRLLGEIEKLISYIGERPEITENDIEALVPRKIEGKIFDMVRYVALRNQKAALNLYYELLAAKEPPMRTLFNLGRQFNQVYMVKELRRSGLNSKQIAAKMKLRDFVVENLIKQSERFTEETLKSAVSECVELEEAVKMGRLGEEMSVELFIIKYSVSERGN